MGFQKDIIVLFALDSLIYDKCEEELFNFIETQKLKLVVVSENPYYIEVQKMEYYLERDDFKIHFVCRKEEILEQIVFRDIAEYLIIGEYDTDFSEIPEERIIRTKNLMASFNEVKNKLTTL